MGFPPHQVHSFEAALMPVPARHSDFNNDMVRVGRNGPVDRGRVREPSIDQLLVSQRCRSRPGVLGVNNWGNDGLP